MALGRKPRVGDRVCNIRYPQLGVGVVDRVNDEERLAYVGANEWIHEMDLTVLVKFRNIQEWHVSSTLASEEMFNEFSRLAVGDLVAVSNGRLGIITDVSRPTQGQWSAHYFFDRKLYFLTMKSQLRRLP